MGEVGPRTEVEAKLAPPPGFRLPDLEAVLPGSVLTTAPDLVLQASYYDTDDLRLARAGASLRHRSDDGWTVKLPAGQVAGYLLRDEHRFPGPAGTPPEAAAALVRALARTARLRVVSRLRTLRRTSTLHDEAGQPLVVVTDDEVSVLDGRRVAARFRELEVELAPGAPRRAADTVVAALGEAGAGTAEPVPKIVRALGPRALAAPDVTPAERLPGDATAGEVVRHAIATSTRRLVAHDPGVRLGEDPEAVHQARVAARRLRSDLRTFRTLLDPGWVRSLRDELQWLGAELGAVRDLEVLQERLRRETTRLPEPERRHDEHTVGHLDARWRAAREELILAISSPRYLGLLDRLVEASAGPPFLPEASAPATTVLPPLVRRPWLHLRKGVEALPADPPDADLHAVRILAKRCRYAAEAAAPIVGKRARAFARAVAGVQEVLGEHQDAVVAIDWLRQVATLAPPGGAFAAGMLAGVEAGNAAAARDRFPAAWEAASRRRLRDWL